MMQEIIQSNIQLCDDRVFVMHQMKMGTNIAGTQKCGNEIKTYLMIHSN